MQGYGWKRFKEKTAKDLQIPEDILLDLTRVTVTGKKRICIDNHRGLKGYDTDRVEIASADGMIRIRGDGFCIDEFENNRIVISGTIDGVEYGG